MSDQSDISGRRRVNFTTHGMQNTLPQAARQFRIEEGEQREYAVPPARSYVQCRVCLIPLANCRHGAPVDDRDPEVLYEDDFENLPGWTAQIQKHVFDPQIEEDL